MNEPEKQDAEFKIPFADVMSVLKKSKLKITFGTLAFAALLGGYALIKPVQYEGEATFKEKSTSQSATNTSSLATMLLSGFSSGGKSEAKTMMSSKKLLQHVVKILNLQASLNEETGESALLKRVRENITVEYNYLRKVKGYPLPDPESAISPKNIQFPGEFPLSLKLVFDTENTYQLFDVENKKIGSGKLGTPFTTREYSFTIAKAKDLPLKKLTYGLTLIPLNDIVSSLSKKIDISHDKEDPSLLKLSYFNRNRQLACDIINQLMYTYQDYLRTEQQRIASEQISYLNRREDEMGQNLKAMIEDYAAKLSLEVSTVGYADSGKAMDFLTTQLQQYREKTLLLDLELKRLTGVLDEETETQMDAYFRADSNPQFINSIIEDICELKQQGDCIELAIRNTSMENLKKWEASFQDQVSEIDEIRQCSKDACLIIAQLDKGQFPLRQSKLMENPKYMINAWQEQLQGIEQSWKHSSSASERQTKKEEWQLFKEQFSTYLTNLIHYLEVREKTIQERLSHQQAPQGEFQGINLDTRSELYISYSKQLSDVEADILQYNFLIDELKDPDFEISSLSSVITDSVTRELVETASTLVLALQDDANRSVKEKDRMKNELQIKRRFLSIHLNQTIDLLKLRMGLIKDKIQSLQSATLELIQQKVSILEKQLSDSIETHISNLKEERKLIAEHHLDLKHEMATLPQKWATEKMIEHQLKMNTTMVEEVTKLVESKNIATNLEIIQSAPVDLAVSNVRPLRPKLILYTVLGVIIGALMTSFAVVTRSVVQGFPASKEGLELSGLHVSGTLSKTSDDNIQTVRRLAAFISKKESAAQSSTLLLANGRGYDCSSDITTLLHKKGLNVLVMDFTDTENTSETSQKNLLQYLEGQISAPPIEKGTQHDKLYLGGSYGDTFEKISSRKFRDLLSQLKEQYDWIIAVTNDTPESVEVEAMIRIFDYAALNVNGETLNKFYQLIQTLKKEGKDNVTSFLITEDC